MIDEDRTMQLFGYTSDKARYRDKIVTVCDECGKYRVVVKGKKGTHYNLCNSCAKIGKHHTKESKLKMSEAHIGRHHTEEDKRKMSEAQTKRYIDINEHIKISAGHQGIDIEDWEGFISEKKYCIKFDAPLREHIREKYDHRCFICDVSQDKNLDKNNKIRKLCVHHVDGNKDQGCNGHKWNLIPVCMHCHGMSHMSIWIARIEYLLEYEYA